MNRKLSQFRYETEGWKRCLEFLSAENTLLQKRVEEAKASHPLDKSFQQDADRFNTDFLQSQHEIAETRRLILLFENQLSESDLEQPGVFESMLFITCKLRNATDHLLSDMQLKKRNYSNLVSD